MELKERFQKSGINEKLDRIANPARDPLDLRTVSCGTTIPDESTKRCDGLGTIYY